MNSAASRSRPDSGAAPDTVLARVAAAPHAGETHDLPPSQPGLLDTLSLLDHRTREHVVPARDAGPGRYLAAEGPDGAEYLIELSRPITHIGRGLIADVRLEDPHVSRRHAIVALRGTGPGGVRVLDDRSLTGTWVNGQSVSVVPLADGDIIRVGRAVLRYVEIAPRGDAARRPRADHAPRLRRAASGWGPTPRPRTLTAA